MSNLTILKNFFSAKKCKVSLQSPSLPLEVEIETPDLRDNKFSVWGDWGPMYSVEVLDEQAINILYRNKENGKSESKAIAPKQIQILSPALAKERRDYPFFLKILDPQKSLIFQIYMDQRGRPAKAEAFSTDRGIKHDVAFTESTPSLEA